MARQRRSDGEIRERMRKLAPNYKVPLMKIHDEFDFKAQKEIINALADNASNLNPAFARKLSFDRPFHSGQAKIWNEFIKDDSKRLGVVNCGRRWGKSFFCTNICLWYLLSKTNITIAYVTPKFKHLLEIYENLLSDLERSNAILNSNKQEGVIRLKNGSRIYFYSTHLDKEPCRGKSLDLVVFDEAGLESDLQRIYQKAIYPATIDCKGKILIISSPLGSNSGFVKMYMEGKEAKRPTEFIYSASTYENPHIDPKELDAYKEKVDERIFNEEIMAIPCADSGIVFSGFYQSFVDSVANHTVKMYGVDLASTQDYTVICGLNDVRELVYLNRFRGVDWNEVKNRVSFAINRIPSIMDTTGVGRPIYDFLKNSHNIQEFTFNNTNKQMIIDKLKFAIQNKQLRIYNKIDYFDDLVSELNGFEYRITDTGKLHYAAGYGYTDDIICALAMANYLYEGVPAMDNDAWLTGKSSVDFGPNDHSYSSYGSHTDLFF